MKLNNLKKWVVLGVCVSLLSACASTGHRSKNGNESYQSSEDSQSSQTSGLGGGDRFVGGYDISKEARLKAPQNQIYFFDFDSSEVHGDNYASIDAQANYLLSHPDGHLLLTGNTDERGSREYNIALGYRRAQSVLNRLTMDGVSKSQVRLLSYGAEKPIVTGHNDEAYGYNRNVQLIYEAKG